jgi:hypothetical protein
MDALTPTSPYERVVVMAASQTGKTELALNFCGYIIDRDPGPVLVVLPRVEDGEAWSKDRLAPMLRSCDLLHVCPIDDEFVLGDPYRQQFTNALPRHRVEVLQIRHEAFRVHRPVQHARSIVWPCGQGEQVRLFLLV